MKNDHKPVIETMINSAALALMSFAIVTLTTTGLENVAFLKSLILIAVAVSLEWFKYHGRQKNLW